MEEAYESNVTKDFEVWLRPKTAAGEVTAADLVSMSGSLIARLRSVMTFDEVHSWIHKILMVMEVRLQEGRAFINPDTGETVNMTLAEERRVLEVGEDQVPDTIPEDWV